MATTRTISTLAGAAAALVLVAAPAHGDELPASASISVPGRNEVELDLERRLHRVLAGRSIAVVATPQSTATSSPPSGKHSYGWPIKPFHTQHPVRGFFGDPRIGMTPKGMHCSFHFGIDISVPDGSPVYATLSGTVQRWPHRPEVVGIRGDDGHVSFEYWHIRPVVVAGERVTAHRTVVGYVEEGWGHVHFSELRDDVYLNPLRLGALGPFEDSTRPVVKSLRAERDAAGVKLQRVFGSVDLVAEAFDVTPLPVPKPWADRPVTPASIRWRVRGRPWSAAVDVRRGLPAADRYGEVYALWTRQNKPWSNGRYRFYLVRGWDTTTLPDGAYHIDVAASDTRGNTSVRSFSVRIANGRA